MIYNIKVYDKYSNETAVIKGVQYDSDKNTLVCVGEHPLSANNVINALMNTNMYVVYLSKDNNNKLSAGENDGLTYDIIKSIEFPNLNKTQFVCTNLLSIGGFHCIVRVDYISRNSTSTDYYITKDGWDAIKYIINPLAELNML